MKIILLIGIFLMLVCLTLIVYLLTSPIRLNIDSRKGNYRIGWNRWMYATLCRESESWGIRIRLSFWTKRFELEKMMFSGRKRLEKSDSKSKTKFNWLKAKKMWKAIKISDLRLIIDTHDVVLNAYLFPVFELMRIKTRKLIRINFTGQNEICLKANVRMINLLKAGYL
jgi:hypothetical protein